MDMVREFPDLHSLARWCFRLHPRAAASTPADCSKMGGAFLQPGGEPWPSDPDSGEEYYPVLQVLRKDLKTRFSDPQSLFPFQEGTDCFQLLWVPGSEGELKPRILVRWLESGRLGMSSYIVPFRKNQGDQLFPLECKLYPEEILEYPHRWALSEYLNEVLLNNRRFLKLAQENGDGDNPLAFYQTHLGCAPGTKLLGHPHWVQYPEWPLSDRGFAMEHLLTISSSEWDHGDYRRWKPVEERDPNSANGPNNDPDLMIGDAGETYVCFSKRESGWPVKAVSQCS